MDIIQVKNLAFAYNNSEENADFALKNIDFAIEKGDFVAVLGHNGSGKSTLAKLFNGILLPTIGDVFIHGMNTKDENLLYDIREKCGMVFQNPDNQIVATVVEEDVAFACENMGLPQTEIRRRVDDALAAVQMSEFCAHAPHLLSGGQKQRVAIAGVLAMEPEIIIMDEPTAMLDPSGRREIMAAITRLNAEKGITIVLITHHMDEAAMAKRVVVLEQGQIALDGTPREVFSQVERVKALSLDVPQTVEILHELKKSGADVDLDCIDIDECAMELLRYLGANKR